MSRMDLSTILYSIYVALYTYTMHTATTCRAADKNWRRQHQPVTSAHVGEEKKRKAFFFFSLLLPGSFPHLSGSTDRQNYFPQPPRKMHATLKESRSRAEKLTDAAADDLLHVSSKESGWRFLHCDYPGMMCWMSCGLIQWKLLHLLFHQQIIRRGGCHSAAHTDFTGFFSGKRDGRNTFTPPRLCIMFLSRVLILFLNSARRVMGAEKDTEDTGCGEGVWWINPSHYLQKILQPLCSIRSWRRRRSEVGVDGAEEEGDVDA